MVAALSALAVPAAVAVAVAVGELAGVGEPGSFCAPAPGATTSISKRTAKRALNAIPYGVDGIEVEHHESVTLLAHADEIPRVEIR